MSRSFVDWPLHAAIRLRPTTMARSDAAAKVPHESAAKPGRPEPPHGTAAAQANVVETRSCSVDEPSSLLRQEPRPCRTFPWTFPATR